MRSVRRNQKSPTAMLPLRSWSRNSSRVMRKPLATKNVVTPRPRPKYPVVASAQWCQTTAAAANARSPSSAPKRRVCRYFAKPSWITTPPDPRLNPSGLDQTRSAVPAPSERWSDDVPGINHERDSPVKVAVLERVVRGRDDDRVVSGEGIRIHRDGAQAEVVTARPVRRREVRIAVVDLRSGLEQQLEDLVRRRLTVVVDIGLVGKPEDENAGAFDGLVR